MIDECREHGKSRTRRVCCHIAHFYDTDGTGMRISKMTEILVDTENIGGRFGEKVIFCDECIKIFSLSKETGISFMSMINEGNSAHYAALCCTEFRCKICIENLIKEHE